MRRVGSEIINRTRRNLRRAQTVDQAAGNVDAKPHLSVQEMDRLRNYLRSRLRRKLGRQ
jgi:hypothetical protein